MIRPGLPSTKKLGAAPCPPDATQRGAAEGSHVGCVRTGTEGEKAVGCDQWRSKARDPFVCAKTGVECLFRRCECGRIAHDHAEGTTFLAKRGQGIEGVGLHRIEAFCNS